MTENPLDYSFVFEKEGKFNGVWLAATNQKRFNQKYKRKIDQYQITDICKEIETEILRINDTPATSTLKKKSRKPPKKRRRIIVEEEETPETQNDNQAIISFNLKLASNLMMGAVRIYSSQVTQLYDESKLMVAKQATYNAFIHAQTVEEERRKSRINYVEILEKEEFETANKGDKKKKKSGKGKKQNEVLEDLSLNTAHIDQITLRETGLGEHPNNFAISFHDEIRLNDFEPLSADDINFFFEGNISEHIDEVRHHTVVSPEPEYRISDIAEDHFSKIDHINKEQEMEQPGDLYVNQPIDDDNFLAEFIETYVDPNFQQEPVELEDVNVGNQPNNEKRSVHFQDVPIQDFISNEEPENVPQIVDPPREDDIILPMLSSKSIKEPTPKTKRGKKRKIDDVTKFTGDEMLKHIYDTSDIVHKATQKPPLKKFCLALPSVLIRDFGHNHSTGNISDVLKKNFAMNVKFLSLTETTRKRKLNAVCAKDNNEPVAKKKRQSNRLQSHLDQISDLFVQEQPVIAPEEPFVVPDQPQEEPIIPQNDPPQVPYLPENLVDQDIMPPPPEIITNVPVEVPFEITANQSMPGYDQLINELIENEAMIQTEAFVTPEAPVQESPEDSTWKRVKDVYGQVNLIRQLTRFFRIKEKDLLTIDMIIAKERTKKVGSVTFSSLIHLKGKRYVELDKNEKLEITRIRNGAKIKKILAKFTKIC